MTQTKITRALISVSDKTGLLPFASALHALGIVLISTGGTAQLLKNAHIPVTDVASITGFPEMMDGRLKTLHPIIHGGILGRRSQDEAIAAAHHIDWIDLVVVNLYPFAKTIQQPCVLFEQAIEQIDIGGPAMIRSAAKNMADVTVIVDPDDYDKLLDQMGSNEGISVSTRLAYASKAFEYTAAYDALIHDYLRQHLEKPAHFPSKIHLTYDKAMDLRYGENPHQQASAYRLPGPAQGIFSAIQHQGKTLSYNNFVDADAAMACVNAFETPSCVIVKHANPCGIASAPSIAEAFHWAFETDSSSAFGGIVALNRPCDAKTANALIQIFFEVVIAPGFEDAALTILSQKPNVRVLTLPKIKTLPEVAYQWIDGGVLAQTNPDTQFQPSVGRVVTEKPLSPELIENLIFAWRGVNHVKSNAILIAKENRVIGIGAGQVSRIDAVDIAIRKSGDKLAESVLASDAFFPFRDSIDRIANTGIKAIIQPGGSLRDQEVIDACNEWGIAMLMTGSRCFKH